MLPPRVRRLFRLPVHQPERLEPDVREEIAFHIEQRTAQLIARGVPPERAHAEAVRRFGRMDEAHAGIHRSAQRREEKVRLRQRLDSLRLDLRYTLRAIRTSPGFTGIIVLTLGLGIGANTAIFSVVDAVLLRPLPYPAPERLVVVGDAQGGDDILPASYPEFVDWRSRSTEIFTAVGAYFSTELTLSGGDEPEMLDGARVSSSMPEILGVTPLRGRWFRPDEEPRGGERVVLISEELWSRRFGRDPSLIGRSLTLSGNPYTVIGVMPSGGRSVLPGDLVTGRRRDFWIPLRLDTDVAPRGLHFMTVIGRLRTDITLDAARSRMGGVADQLKKDGVTKHGIELVSASDRIVGPIRTRLILLLGAVGLVLLIACANVANLLLGRAAARHRETAVRIALGAGRTRVAGQLILESVLRALLGGALGIAIAYGALALARGWLPSRLPRAGDIALDERVLLFALAISIATGLLFGVYPALRAAHQDAGTALREGSRGLSAGLGRDRVRIALVVAEVALSFVLLANAGLLLRSFGRLTSVETGFDAERTLVALVLLPQSRYADSTRQISFFDALLERAATIPGVRKVALTSSLPVEGGINGGFSIEGVTFPDSAEPMVEKRVVSANYFDMLGAPIVSGRNFTERDRLGSPGVMIVNESFARKWFPDGRVVGRRVAFSWGTEGMQTVIGVVADIREGALDAPPAPAMYVPLAQRPNDAMNVVMRTSGEPLDAAPALRRVMLGLDRDLALTQVRTLADVLSSGVAGPRLSATLLGIFSMLALFLAAIGLYGVISFSVVQRTREIGIRSALGAGRGNILRLVLGQGFLLVLLGLLAGVGLALASGRLVASQLFGVAPNDPGTLSAVAAILVLVAMLAATIPALRATRIDPLVALRED